jgi:hypothetical protein
MITCIERLLILQKYINLVIKDLDENIWKDIQNLYIYLYPFKEYINCNQKDDASDASDASLYCVHS